MRAGSPWQLERFIIKQARIKDTDAHSLPRPLFPPPRKADTSRHERVWRLIHSWPGQTVQSGVINAFTHPRVRHKHRAPHARRDTLKVRGRKLAECCLHRQLNSARRPSCSSGWSRRRILWRELASPFLVLSGETSRAIQSGLQV